jgi:hypothetical protein
VRLSSGDIDSEWDFEIALGSLHRTKIRDVDACHFFHEHQPACLTPFITYGLGDLMISA